MNQPKIRLLTSAVVLLCLAPYATADEKPEIQARPAIDPLDEAASAALGQEGSDRSGWYFRSEALWLKRDRSGPQRLADLIPFTTSPVLTTKDVDFDHAPGFRCVLGRQLDADTSLELTYSGLNSWSESGTVDYPFAPIPEPALAYLYFPSQHFRFDYSSELHNLELGLRQRLRTSADSSISLLAGLRYLHLQDDMTLTGSLVTPVPLDVEVLHCDARNHLLGLQLGGEYARQVGRHMTVSLAGKAGLLANFADQDLGYAVLPALGPAWSFAASEQDVALASSLDLSLRVNLWLTRNLLLRGGYEVFYLSGLALAPDQTSSLGTDIVFGRRGPGSDRQWN